MNIVFLIPPSPDKRKIIRLIDCSHESKADYLWQPTDFMIISSHISPEDGAVLVDGTADRMEKEEFFRVLKDIRPDIIFFALSSICWESDHDYFLRIRALFPSSPLYVIGDVFLEEEYRAFILRDCAGIVFNPFFIDLLKMKDTPVEKPYSLPGIWTAPEVERENVKKTARISSNYPRHELFLKKGYGIPFARHFRLATVMTVWGCPFLCSYCPDSQFSPLFRPYRDVLRELEYLESLGIEELFFADKSFGYPVENIQPLLDEMAKRFRFSWTCYFNPQLYKRDLLELMKAAGCHTIIVGIDSADTDALKRYNRRIDSKKINDLVYHANNLGISICADFILGLEHETEEDITDTIDYALKLPIDFASFNIAAPFPGTAIRRKAKESGKMTFGMEGYDSLSHSGDLGICGVSYETIRRLRNKAVRRFYLRPSYLLRRLKRTVSLEHFLVQLRQMAAMLRKV